MKNLFKFIFLSGFVLCCLFTLSRINHWINQKIEQGVNVPKTTYSPPKSYEVKAKQKVAQGRKVVIDPQYDPLAPMQPSQPAEVRKPAKQNIPDIREVPLDSNILVQ
jgi:hypothetical protein